MREADVPIELCATVLGISESTVLRRSKSTERAPREPRAIDAAVRGRVAAIVRATNGLAGAASLGKQCDTSRRISAEIKRDEKTRMERERKAGCGAVRVTTPGVIRGFDAMQVQCIDRRSYWLVAADAAIPYRTSITSVDVYDSARVIEALADDFETHGPPLVLRLDRIACQRTPDVHALLRKYQVLPLHGPPRHPYYYGQLERQNREHRAWYSASGPIARSELDNAAARMKTALNALWARPTLDWCTAEQAWNHRSTVNVDRVALHSEVVRNTERLVALGYETLRAERTAIESALTVRGLLSINQGGTR